jgi:hypothetical protein
MVLYSIRLANNRSPTLLGLMFVIPEKVEELDQEGQRHLQMKMKLKFKGYEKFGTGHCCKPEE